MKNCLHIEWIISEAIQSCMIVVVLVCGVILRLLKFSSWYQPFTTACFHRFFYFYNTAEGTWSETSFTVMKKGSYNSLCSLITNAQRAQTREEICKVMLQLQNLKSHFLCKHGLQFRIESAHIIEVTGKLWARLWFGGNNSVLLETKFKIPIGFVDTLA